MNFYYENHNGETIQFYDSQYILTEHSFADWQLSYETTADVSTGFKFGVGEREFIVRIMPRETTATDRATAFKTLINNFVNIIAKDMDVPGKLWTTDGEYMVCRIVASAKSDWNLHRNVSISCKLLSDYPVWIKEKKYEVPAQSSSGTDEFLDFPYDFAYDYMSGQTGQVQINNEGYGGANWKLIIYGAAVDPYIFIDDIPIGVYTTLSTGDYLTIDSRTKTVYTTQLNGTVVNQFNNRFKSESIFEKIGAGRHIITWSKAFGFDLIIYEERREPEWI